jgi:hypothetical protein
MKIITIKMSEEGRDEIITARVEIADEGYALAYFNSVEAGFITFSAFTVLGVTMEDEPTLDQKIVALEEDLTDAMIDKMDEAEEAIKSGENEGDFDDYVEDDETGEKRGIVYPENAAPELDHARQLVGEAVLALRGQS